MKLKLPATALLSVLAISGGVSAHAADPVPCRDNVVIVSVYERGTSGRFQYFIELRNPYSRKITTRIDLGSFPMGTGLLTDTIPDIVLGPYKNKQLGIGNGTSSQINDHAVKKFYDHVTSRANPYVLARDCSR